MLSIVKERVCQRGLFVIFAHGLYHSLFYIIIIIVFYLVFGTVCSHQVNLLSSLIFCFNSRWTFYELCNAYVHGGNSKYGIYNNILSFEYLSTISQKCLKSLAGQCSSICNHRRGDMLSCCPHGKLTHKMKSNKEN